MTLRRSNARCRGFTLIEAALVTVIVGVGVVGMIQLLAAGSMANASATELTTGLNLANNIRELTQGVAFRDPAQPFNFGPEAGETLDGAKPFNDLDDFHKQTFSPPIDARRQALAEFTGWSQTVHVQPVDMDMLTLEVPPGLNRPMARITVTIHRNGREVCSVNWLVVEAP